MFLALIVIVLGTLVIGSLVTPSIYVGLSSSFPEFPWPYSRVFDRVAMLLVLIFCIVLRKHFSIKRAIVALKSIKFSTGAYHWLVGLLVSFIPTFLVLLLIVNGEDLVWREAPIALFITKFYKIFLAALVVSLIEESFFRVILLDSIREKFSLKIAVLVTSVLYGVVHFISPVKSWEFSKLSFSVGFEYLFEIFSRFSSFDVMCGMFGLFLIGIVLCISITKSRSIYFTMGLHAGWIFLAKFAHYCTELTPTTQVASAIGRRYYLVSIPMAWMVIALVGILAYFIGRKLAKREKM